jgi:hypothetical protein
MKSLADEMASVERKFEDEELVSDILMGINVDFDPMVSAVTVRVEPITVVELYTQLVSHEQRLEIRGGGGGNQSSTNLAVKGGRGNNNRGGGRGGGGGRGNYGHGHKGGCVGGGGRNTFHPGVFC